MRKIAKKFQGQPLVVLSVSLDGHEQKWKDFIAKNGMTWPQCYDGGFTDRSQRCLACRRVLTPSPSTRMTCYRTSTFGDASIEGKLKKLVGRARELQAAEKTTQ